MLQIVPNKNIQEAGKNHLSSFIHMIHIEHWILTGMMTVSQHHIMMNGRRIHEKSLKEGLCERNLWVEATRINQTFKKMTPRLLPLPSPALRSFLMFFSATEPFLPVSAECGMHL